MRIFANHIQSENQNVRSSFCPITTETYESSYSNTENQQVFPGFQSSLKTSIGKIKIKKRLICSLYMHTSLRIKYVKLILKHWVTNELVNHKWTVLTAYIVFSLKSFLMLQEYLAVCICSEKGLVELQNRKKISPDHKNRCLLFNGKIGKSIILNAKLVSASSWGFTLDNTLVLEDV